MNCKFKVMLSDPSKEKVVHVDSFSVQRLCAEAQDLKWFNG
jgi:hypothetical protein